MPHRPHLRPPPRSLATGALWTGTAFSVLGCVGAALVARAEGYKLNWGGSSSGSLSVAMGVTFPVLGAAILTIRPRDRVGRVLDAMGALACWSVIALAWSYHGLVTEPGSLPVAAAAGMVGGIAKLATLALFPLLLVWLPDGHVDRTFRWIPTAVVGLVTLALVAMIVAWPVRGAAILTGNGPHSTRNSIADGLSTGVIFGQLVLSTLALVALVGKLRESDEVRQQLKWLLFGTVIAVVGNTTASLVPVLSAARIAGFGLMVTSIGIAVFRYRLWDVDRLIKGTIVYGALSAALIGVFAGGGVVAGALLGTAGASLVASCLVTAVAVVVLKPAHRWMQDRLDRVFDRRSWEAAQRVRLFTAGLGGDPPEPGDLQALLAEVLGDDGLTLVYRLADGDRVDPWGHSAHLTPETPRSVAVAAIGAGAAEIGHRPMTAGDRNRLDRVLAESRVALEHGRMQAELQRQLVEVRRSRARLVTATDTERRRIERDLHDGVQAQLVALGLTLRAGQRHSRPNLDETAETLIDQAVAGVRDAIAELRRLAHGVIPPLLVSGGLSGALAELATRVPTPITTEIDVAERPAGPIESTAWYVACEGITNALKHAPGSRIGVSIRGDSQQLSVEVSDCGPGGADPTHGTGLAGLTDRVEAIGGTLTVLSPAGAGTTLRAVLPCGS